MGSRIKKQRVNALFHSFLIHRNMKLCFVSNGGIVMSGRCKKILILGMVLALVITSVFGCRTKKRAVENKKVVVEKPVTGGTFIYSIKKPTSIDPYNAKQIEDFQIVANIFDSLVSINPLTFGVEPAVAEKWKSNEDATVWTFTLRKGTKFHNGREVKAADFKYAWERIVSPKTEPPSEIPYHLSAVEGFDEMQEGRASELSGLRVLDDYTLEVTLSYSLADFIYIVGHPSLAPVPKEEVEKDTKAFIEKPVGNGPFMLEEPWKRNEYVKVVRFGEYYGQKGFLDEVIFKVFGDEVTSFLEFQEGNVDFSEVPVGEIDTAVKKYGEGEYKASPGKDLLLGTEAATYFINVNNGNPVLRNVDVRRAISLAINRAAIVKTVFGRARKPATGLIPQGVVGFKKGVSKYSRYDPEEAEKLLEKAGYAGGQGLPTLKLSFDTGAEHEQVMKVIQTNLKDVGINVELQGMTWREFLNHRQDGKHVLARDGWVFDYPVMDNMLFLLFHSNNIGDENASRYSNPRVDEILLKARTDTNEEERVKLYQEAENLILDEAAVIPIVFYTHHHIVSKRVRGFVFSPLLLANMEDVWLTGK